MLKRNQVLLTDWLEDYVRYIGKRYDYSFSEVIRLCLCILFCEVLSKMYPKHKFGVDLKKIIKLSSNSLRGKADEEDLHRLISKIYFEARKAVEFNLSQIKKRKKHNRFKNAV